MSAPSPHCDTVLVEENQGQRTPKDKAVCSMYVLYNCRTVVWSSLLRVGGHRFVPLCYRFLFLPPAQVYCIMYVVAGSGE
jgi:hypothetical protein